jgi:hypothetical protein
MLKKLIAQIVQKIYWPLDLNEHIMFKSQVNNTTLEKKGYCMFELTMFSKGNEIPRYQILSRIKKWKFDNIRYLPFQWKAQRKLHN